MRGILLLLLLGSLVSCDGDAALNPADLAVTDMTGDQASDINPGEGDSALDINPGGGDSALDINPGEGVAADGPKKLTKLKDFCFKHINTLSPHPDYDKYFPTYGTHCHGTNHQNIKGVQKVVYLGDSITAGTPPTPFWQYYRNQLSQLLTKKFGPLEVKNCSAFGARTDDLFKKPHQQIISCFDKLPEAKTTLVIITIGGNDAHSWAKDASDGKSIIEILKTVDQAAKDMRDAIQWFTTNAKQFTGGVFVIFASVYEYTDGTGELMSCPISLLAGLKGYWPEGRKAYIKINEEFMKIAVDTKTDMVFMLENFCGHGFKAKDPWNECYLGPTAKLWFDLTCIHPNPTGHTEIAKMFMSVVNQ